MKCFGAHEPLPSGSSVPASGCCAPFPSALPSPPPLQVLHGGWPDVREEGPLRYGPNAAAWVRVNEGWTLGEALQRPDHVVPGIPAFFVLAKDSPVREQFLDNDLPLL